MTTPTVIKCFLSREPFPSRAYFLAAAALGPGAAQEHGAQGLGLRGPRSIAFRSKPFIFRHTPFTHRPRASHVAAFDSSLHLEGCFERGRRGALLLPPGLQRCLRLGLLHRLLSCT